MNSLPEPSDSCRMSRALWPALLERQLRGGYLQGPLNIAAAHLTTCGTCTAEFAELLTLMRWREAEAPFNIGSLPVTDRRQPNATCQGAPCDPTTL